MKHLVLLGLLLVAAGCTSEKAAVEPVDDATHVTGTVTAIDDDRPVDGGVTLTLRTAAKVDDQAYVRSIFTGQPPTTEVLALQQKVSELKVGDRIRATGSRDAEGRFLIDRIEVLDE